MVDIFLDDKRETPPGFIRAFTVEDCMALLAKHKGNVRKLSLDNDLGIPGLENEGREVVKRLCELTFGFGTDLWPFEVVTIHSANPVARDYMGGMIVRYAPRFVQVSPTVFDRQNGIW